MACVSVVKRETINNIRHRLQVLQVVRESSTIFVSFCEYYFCFSVGLNLVEPQEI